MSVASGQCDTGINIGKLVQIYETAAHERMVRAVWFFFPRDIRKFLGDYEPKWNEIFLASGKGKGLSNLNRVESIVGKCEVFCASNDQRNPQASKQQLETADYIFYRPFDVGTCRILESFPDQICGLEGWAIVELFFNKRRNQMPGKHGTLKTNVKELSGKSGVMKKMDGRAVKDGKSGSSSNPVVKESKTDTYIGQRQHFSNKPNTSKFSKDPLPPNAARNQPFKKRKLPGMIAK
ncbi:unnamed protein product [Dovyalis caffra]|uniref:BAH domain-containing protein n=1 Tax=Dovyalis caffra TaxID=77055 RepID=A0AAV1SRE0_9ROSI|nr:unnamed protein product [Dovyalis caffra]